MPCGKCCKSATMLPLAPRLTCQQSSMLTYTYPASFMPDLTRASAMPLIMSSLTLQANLFHEFHPMGGVRAKALDVALFSCAERLVVTIKITKTTATTRLLGFMRCFYQNSLDICTKNEERGRNRAGSDRSDLQSSIAPFTLFHATEVSYAQRPHLVASGVGLQFLCRGS